MESQKGTPQGYRPANRNPVGVPRQFGHRVVLELYWDIGKYYGNYRDYRDCIGIMGRVQAFAVSCLCCYAWVAISVLSFCRSLGCQGATVSTVRKSSTSKGGGLCDFMVHGELKRTCWGFLGCGTCLDRTPHDPIDVGTLNPEP